MTSNKPPKKYNPSKLGSQKDDNKLTYVLGGVAVVAIIALIVIFVVIPGQKGTETLSDYGALENATVEVTDPGTILVGSASAPETLEVYEDFICPACGQFEMQYGGGLNEAIDAGEIAVDFHMLNFLNQTSASGDYSTRAAAATLCIADTGDAKAFSIFHSKLFATDTQPRESGKSDLSNDDLADLANAAGASEEAVSCVSSGGKVDLAAEGAAASAEKLAAKNDGQVGTPAVFDGDQKVELGNTSWLADIIG